jgi:hypothetical protein
LPDPVTTAIATAVAGSAAQALTEQAARLLAQVTAKIRHRLGKDPRELTGPSGTNGAPERTAALASLLHQAFQDDPAFANELTVLWHDYLNATASVSSNHFHGSADKVVQLHDVHGNLTIS